MGLFSLGRGENELVTSLPVFHGRLQKQEGIECNVRNVLLREMRVFTLLFFSFTCFVCLALAEEDAETGKTPPMQEWLDPGDMIHYDTDRVLESSVSFVTLFNSLNVWGMLFNESLRLNIISIMAVLISL